jgi:hypothetical protein
VTTRWTRDDDSPAAAAICLIDAPSAFATARAHARSRSACSNRHAARVTRSSTRRFRRHATMSTTRDSRNQSVQETGHSNGVRGALVTDTPTCSATTIRDRRDEWIRQGIFSQLKQIVLEAYDRIVGLILDDIAVDGCITKAPGGGECAGRSPVDRGKQGMKR